MANGRIALAVERTLKASGVIGAAAALLLSPPGYATEIASTFPLVAGPSQRAGSVESGPPSAQDRFDFKEVLTPLLKSAESRRLLFDLRLLVEQDDLAAAQQLLQEPLEAGTVSALILNRLASPGLKAFLENLDTSLEPSKASASSTLTGLSGDYRLQQAQVALAREARRAEAAAQEVALLRADLASRDADERRRAAEFGDLGQRARQQIEAITRNWEALQAELAAARGRESETQAELRQMREQRSQSDVDRGNQAAVHQLRLELEQAQAEAKHERSRAEQVASELASWRERASSDAALGQEQNAKLAELSGFLDRERRRAEAMSAELTGLKRETGQLEAKSSQAEELARALNREKKRAEAAVRQAAAATREVVRLTTEKREAAALVDGDTEATPQKSEPPPAMMPRAAAAQLFRENA